MSQPASDEAYRAIQIDLGCMANSLTKLGENPVLVYPCLERHPIRHAREGYRP